MSPAPNPLALMRRALAEPPERPERVPPGWWQAMVVRAEAGRASIQHHDPGAVPVACFDSLPGEWLGPIASTEPEALALAGMFGAPAPCTSRDGRSERSEQSEQPRFSAASRVFRPAARRSERSEQDPAGPPSEESEEIADVPRLRRLSAFAADPEGAIAGWRLATLARAHGCDLSLTAGGLIAPRGFAALPPFLVAEARRERDALAAWLALERDVPAALREHARPPFGAAEALAEGLDFCIACGLPPEGACATWWAAPGSRAWSCATCCPPPDDDRVTCAYGRSGSDPSTAEGPPA
jgi:hypothetical protein